MVSAAFCTELLQPEQTAARPNRTGVQRRSNRSLRMISIGGNRRLPRAAAGTSGIAICSSLHIGRSSWL
jgi:hypothetical protein